MKKHIRTFMLCLLIAVLTLCSGCGAEEKAKPVTVDLDLSWMSGTVVYAQVLNLLYDPEPWLGKNIRMAGYYNYYDDQARGIVYHACVIPDATACCATGIEFVREGEHAWPDEYPEAGTDIYVTGRLELYEEDGTQYLHLVDAEMILQEKEAALP